MIQHSFCLDAIGNLIRLESTAATDQLIPCALEIVTTAHELAHPLPWTLTASQALKELRFAPHPLTAGSIAEQALTKGELPGSSFLFVPGTLEYATEPAIQDMFALYDQLPSGHEGREQVVAALATVGIVPIPLLQHFNPDLHEPTDTDAITGYSVAGWISNAEVHRKAVICQGSTLNAQ